MRSPESLYTIHQEPSLVKHPVLVYAFSGFVDAGGGVRLAAAHILDWWNILFCFHIIACVITIKRNKQRKNVISEFDFF